MKKFDLESKNDFLLCFLDCFVGDRGRGVEQTVLIDLIKKRTTFFIEFV